MPFTKWPKRTCVYGGWVILSKMYSSVCDISNELNCILGLKNQKDYCKQIQYGYLIDAKHACTMYSTWHIFHFTPIMNACACEIDDLEILVHSSVYALDVSTLICMNMGACQSYTRQTWFASTWTWRWIVSQGWRYKLYEHVLVPRSDCDSNNDIRCKNFLLYCYTIFGLYFYKLSLVILR